MGLFAGALTARRFRVVGELPKSGWRDVVRERLDAFAFREPVGRVGKEEIEGWVLVQNLLDTSFQDFERWLFDPWVVFALRVDKKALPAKLFRATVEKRCEAWCRERGVERCPASAKKEIQERLEEEWLDRALPRVALTEIAWNVQTGQVLVGGLSSSVAERVRKRFHRTFGLELHPWSPLDGLDDPGLAERLLGSTPAVFGGVA